MAKSENVFLKIMDIFAHFVILNALWILLCIPIITIFPATTALFGVVRKWVTEGKGIDEGVFGIFFTQFKENFKKSFIIGILWMIAGFILYFDGSIIQQFQFSGQSIVFAMVILMSMIYVLMTPYIFFILVHYELAIFDTIKNAFLVSISYLIQTLICLIIIMAMVAITLFFKFFILIVGSITAFILYSIFNRITFKIQKAKNITVKSITNSN